MKLQIVSDLHIEYRSDNVPDPLSLITPSADILIMAGDIGSFYKYDQLKTFLNRLCPYFKVVIYVPGNHEFYNQKGYESKRMSTLFKSFIKIEESIKNLFILNRSSLQIGNICIVGCTLWSESNVMIPKFIVRIQDMNTKIYNEKHKGDLLYIKKMIKYCNENNLKLVVVTHHCPTYSVITSKNKLRDKYISLYASNLDYLLTKESVHTWICGHIHINFDKITEGGTRLIGNQNGKPKDNIRDYNKKLVIEV